MRNLIRLSSYRGGGNAALGRARVRLDGPVVDRPSLDRPVLDRKELRMAFEALEVGGIGAGQPGLGADPEDLLVERPAARGVEMRRNLVEQDRKSTRLNSSH